jgi:asparagine synthetase B (glutamine-hydrolysing)
MWLLTSKNNPIETVLDLKVRFSNQLLFADEEFFEYNSNSMRLVVFGNPWPRFELQKMNFDRTNFSWLISVINQNNQGFIKYVKGDFVIFLELENRLLVFNDHFGFSTIYYNKKNQILSNNFNVLRVQSNFFNETSIAQHILVNRTIGDTTFDENIENKEGANTIEFSLNSVKFLKYWDYKRDIVKNSINYSQQDIIDFSKANTTFFYRYFDVGQTFITLTGGKDSRSALAILLNLEIHPIGLNYGSDKSKDIVFAKKLANKIGIECKNVQVKTDSDLYYSLLNELMDDHPMTSIHRTHRYAAFKEVKSNKQSFAVLFNGYLGGELLMGIYPDKLVFTEFVLNQISNTITEKKNNFFETDFTSSILDDLVKKKNSISNDFDAIFTIGVKHHLQDIHLSKKYYNYVFPFFLDVDFIERIFNSNYNFTKVNSKSKNLFKRHRLYELNCELQYQLSPKLRNIPFAKKGNYTLLDYKKGPLFWSVKKVFNHLREKKYPPNFTYDVHYLSWIKEKLVELNANKNLLIHRYFDISKALIEIQKTSKSTFSESEMLPYTRIIMFSNYLSKLN